MEQREVFFMPRTTHVNFRKCTPSWTLDKFTMPNYDLTYVVAGKGRYLIDGVYYSAEQGDLFCSPPGSTREGYTSPNELMNLYVADFDLKDYDGGYFSLPFSLKTHIGIDKDLVRLFSDLVTLWLKKQPGYTIKLHGILFLILYKIYELCVIYPVREGVDDYRINKVIRYIENRYQEKISVKELAALAKLEPHYLNTLFKQKTGFSPHQYLIKTRIKSAYEMLQTGEQTVIEVAELCGYMDIYHFYKQFKSVMGVSLSHCISKGIKHDLYSSE